MDSQENKKIGADKNGKVRNNSGMEIKLLKIDEVCEILRISKPTMYKLIHSKKLKPRSIMSKTVFYQSEVMDYISSLEEKEWLYE